MNSFSVGYRISVVHFQLVWLGASSGNVFLWDGVMQHNALNSSPYIYAAVNRANIVSDNGLSPIRR